MKNLQNYGVQELSAKEIKETEGGFLSFVIAAGVGLFAMGIHDAIDHPQAFVDGFLGKRSR
ncbi:hypothetical protein [uncultured Tenacibaculum sp.]|uniref:hypothetical protein n=1 Tax=uncultured Tenacibaculum sp. TaxID=174713 RepID=UPI00261A71A9|nr:hypothetical protein [uncultured Tenacibaculum sp.]